LRDGVRIVPVPMTDDDTETLIALMWISEAESRNRRKCGEAIAAMLKTLKQK